MSDKPTSAAEAIFVAALEIENFAERTAYVNETCGADARLLARVSALLKAHDHSDSFLEKPPAAIEATILHDATGDDLAASLEAGLAPSFGQEKAVIVGSAGHSVLKLLGNTIDVPHVSLRESEAEGSGPVQRPSSREIPRQQADSRYQLQGEIARGGMGAVIKGRDTDLGRDLAIKVLLDSHKDKPEVIQRFVEEAQIGGQLQHPGIAPVYELGQFADQRPFFSMKLVKGQTLSKLLANREDATEDRPKYLGIFEQVCQTMAYAHSRGVIHRDLKPANIMVGAFGEVQVMDWGLAKVLASGGVADEKESLDNHQGKSIIQTLRSVGSDTPGTFNNIGSQTQMGSVMGTPAYMPPEQALGEIDNMDERADVFGLGAILSEILTGKPPYVADDGTLLFRMASRGKLEDCFERLEACGADSDLIVIAKKCLELEPADRPRDAGALSQQITEYLESVETRLRDTEKQRAAEAARVIEERKRRRIILASSCAVATLLAVIAIGSMLAAGHFREMEQVAKLTANEKATLADEMTQLAAKNQVLADAKDQEAENARTNEQEAITARELAIQAQEDLRRELYLSDMQQVRQAYHEGAPNRVEELLKKYLPGYGEPDQRGWEWYYWWQANYRHAKRLQSENGKEPISDLVVSPDESWFAIREWRDRVGIYDGRAGQTKLRTLPVGVMNPRSSQGRIAVSPDGRLFAAVSDQACVKLWSTEDWSELPVLQHQQQLSTIAFSSNGLLAAGDDLGSVTLWNTAQQTRVGEPLETGGASTCLAFSPDGNRLATGHEGSVTNLLVWDVSKQTIDETLVETQEPVKTLAWTRRNDRSVLAAGFVNGFVRLWDGETYEDRNSLAADGPIESLSFSAGGDRLVAGTSRKNEIHVWETDTGRLVTTAKGHSQAVRGVGFTDNGATVLSSSADATLKSWEVARSAPFDRLPMPTPNATVDKSLTFSADGNVLWRGGMVGPAHRWDFSDPERLPVVDTHEPQKRVAFSANGRYCVEFTPDSEVEYRAHVYEINGVERVLQRNRLIPGIDGPPDQLAISDDGQVVAWSRKSALVWSHFGEGTQKTIAEDGPYTSLALSLNGRALTGSRRREHWPGRWGAHTVAEIWDVSGRTEGWNHFGGDVNQARFSPDGALLALATWEGLYVYATATGERRGQLRGHAGSVTAIDFSRDGQVLVSGGYDGSVRLWDVDDQTLLLTLNTSEQNIVSVAFSPGGGTIASISESGDARLWRGGTEEMQGDRYWKWLADEYSQRAHDQVWPGKFAEALGDYRKLVEVDRQDPVGRANNQLLNSASKLVSWKPLQNASPNHGTCRFTLQQPSSDWREPDFDDSAWQSGGPALAQDAMRGWPDDHRIWVRYEIALATPLSSPLVFLTKVDGKGTVFVNGQEAAQAGWKGAHFQIVPSQLPLQQGRNVIAAFCDGQGAYGAIHVAPGTLRSKDEILSLFAQPEAPLLQHAMIHQTLGNWYEAADCYVTSLQIRSQNPGWTDGLGWQTDRSKMLMDLVGQDSSFDALRQQLPDAHYLWLARGRSLALRKQWQAAREAFSQFLALATPSNGEVVSLLAEAEPELLQHAKLHQTLGNWVEAAACHVAILQARSKSPNWTDGSGWHTERAKMLMNLVGSERLFDALRQQMPDAHDLWLARGRCLALRNKWQAAAEAFSRYLALASPSEFDVEVGFEIACCHLIIDDLEGYHQVANRFRGLAGEKPNPFTAFVLARTAGLAPQTPELAKRAIRWGEYGSTDNSRPWEVHALGLALYRAGDHDAAIARFSESLDAAWYDVANQLALALAYHDGGQHEHARELLRNAEQWRDEQLQRASDGVVQEQVIDWLAVHALLREAEDKIGKQ